MVTKSSLGETAILQGCAVLIKKEGSRSFSILGKASQTVVIPTRYVGLNRHWHRFCDQAEFSAVTFPAKELKFTVGDGYEHSEMVKSSLRQLEWPRKEENQFCATQHR